MVLCVSTSLKQSICVLQAHDRGTSEWLSSMARRDGGAPAAEAAEQQRRVALRVLLSRAEASSPPAAVEEAQRGRSGGGNKGLASAALRGLGCTSTAALRAHAPASAAEMVSSSERWHGRRRRRKGQERRSARGGGGGGGVGPPGPAPAAAEDVWCTCAPGITFTAEASSVDCVVARHAHHTAAAMGSGRRGEAERRHRERPAAPRARRVTMREHISSSLMDSPPFPDMPLLNADLLPPPPPGRHRHGYRQEEIMMLRTRLLWGRLGMHDQHQDWRLDVDNMTYEELLDLEDRIGYVSTGLHDDEISRSLRTFKYSAFNPKHFATEVERNCSICQEEFEANQETGRLICGHSYHVQCIKQWLSRKNTCPVCKTVASKT
uniref:RING-type E3 ubiquitin transferase n=2 Tax=Oryza punctata TaxID=4537 RepID=A0A0E0L5D1_ORYPU